MNIKDFIFCFYFFIYPINGYAETNPLRQFIDNANYELETSVTGYVKSPASSLADRDKVAFLGRFTVKSQSYLTDSLSAGFNLYSTYSTQKHQYYGAFTNPDHRSRQPRYIDFNTAWLRYETDNIEIIVGKDYIETGLSELYSPIDRFGLHNATNPTQSYNMGVWQASVDFFISDDTFTIKVIPTGDKSFIPSEHSRWIGNTNDPEFTALAATYELQEKYRPVRIENIGYLLQYKGSRAGYDFLGLVHHGISIYPTLRQGTTANQFLKIYPLATSIAVGVLKVMEEWKFYADVIYQHTDHNRDEDFIRYALGISYSDNTLANVLGFNQINTTLQWSGDEAIDAEDLTQVNTRSREARPFRNTILGKIEIKHNHRWGYFFSAIHNIESDLGLFAGTEYKPNDNLTFRLEAAFFDGTSQTHFGRWKENDYVRFRTFYKF